MLVVLLCIAFSSTLNFDGLTVSVLWQWFQGHPFLLMMALGEVFSYNINIHHNR